MGDCNLIYLILQFSHVYILYEVFFNFLQKTQYSMYIIINNLFIYY